MTTSPPLRSVDLHGVCPDPKPLLPCLTPTPYSPSTSLHLTSHNQLGPEQHCRLLQHVVVDDTCLLVQTVWHLLKVDGRRGDLLSVGLVAMAQVASMREVQSHDAIMGLQQGRVDLPNSGRSTTHTDGVRGRTKWPTQTEGNEETDWKPRGITRRLLEQLMRVRNTKQEHIYRAESEKRTAM